MDNQDSEHEPSANETAPGVRLLKHAWGINTKGAPREDAPEAVVHDIYSVPPRRRAIPCRHTGERP